jgi:hypothetical protein
MARGAHTATMSRMAHVAPPRELDRRISDGVDIRLCWSAHDDEVFVAVADGKTGDAFEVPVRAGESAREVFHDPYTFAALPGRRRESAPAAPVSPPRRRASWLRDFAPAGRARAL